MDLDLLVRVYSRYGLKDISEVRIGTGYPIAPGRILVARHVLTNYGEQVNPEDITLSWFRLLGKDGKRIKVEPNQIEIAWDGGTDWDAAIISCPFPDGVSVPSNVLANRLPLSDERWSSEGFAETGAYHDERQPQPLKGTTFACAENAKAFQLVVDGAARTAEGWMGLSGSPVFVDGQMIGLITDACKPYEARRLSAIPVFELLKLQTFRDALGNYTTTSIDLTLFKSQIAKQFLSVPAVISRLAMFLQTARILPGPEQEQADHSHADLLAHKLLTQFDFSDVVEIMRKAIEDCSTESEEKEKQVLFNILYWFLPARYDLQKSEEVRRLYINGDIDLIEAYVSTALAAELRMAAVESRAVSFDHDAKGDLVGKNKLPFPLPLGLGATKEEELIKSIEGFLYHKFSMGTNFGRNPEFFCGAINKILERKKKLACAVPYVLFASDQAGLGLNCSELESLAKGIRNRFPCLALLRLSDESEIQSREFENLSSLREMLQRA